MTNPFKVLLQAFGLISIAMDSIEDLAQAGSVWTKATRNVSTSAATKWEASFKLPTEEEVTTAQANREAVNKFK